MPTGEGVRDAAHSAEEASCAYAEYGKVPIGSLAPLRARYMSWRRSSAVFLSLYARVLGIHHLLLRPGVRFPPS